MKIAVLSDIHGNLVALNAVLQDLKNKEIDKIIVAGDHISDCPSPVEVIKVLKDIKAICIKGNREQYIIDYLESGSDEWDHYKQMYSVNWTKNRLTKDDLDWIHNLDDQISMDFQNADSIRVVHGSPFSLTEHLYYFEPNKLDRIMSALNEKVLICGHSHIPWIYEKENSLIVNPGAVGVSFNDIVSADYAILTWDGDSWRAKIQQVPYSYDELFDNFVSSGLYNDGGIWGKLILQSIKDGKNRNIEFIENVKKFNMPSNNSSYFSNEVWEKAIEEWEKEHNIK